MKKLLLPIVVSLLFLGCSNKGASIEAGSISAKNSPFVREALRDYNKAIKDIKLKSVASQELYKASKIARVLSNETNPKLVEHYAYLLKNQVKIARLTKKKLDSLNELNEIITKRNQAIEDAKHQDDVDSDEEEAMLPVAEPNSVKENFNYQSQGDFETYTINGKYFDNDEVIFNKDLKSFISYLVSYLHSHPTKIVVLSSFTDGVGSKAYSIDMALRRANRIKEELVDLEIDEDRVKVDAKGAVNSLASNDSEEGRRKNNRIIVKIK